MADKIFTVDKFLGLNESADGTTELKMGEAAKIENFNITDDYNLKTRPGTGILFQTDRSEKILGLWDGLIGKYHFTVVATSPYYGQHHLQFIARNEAAKALDMERKRYAIYADGNFPMQFFTYRNRLYLVGASWFAYRADTEFDEDVIVPYYVEFYDDGSSQIIHRNPTPYAPVILTGCSPTGAGTELEPMNLIPKCAENKTEEPYEFLGRLQFSADGESTSYTLPALGDSQYIKSVKVDGAELSEYTDFTYLLEYADEDSETFTGIRCTFKNAPPKGVNNVEFLVGYDGADHRDAAKKLVMMRHSEAYNGSTDNRLFFYGDGTNICYYTGAPAFGDGLYVPAGNEIAVDSSASAITGLRTQNTRLLAFKPDGAFSIDYEPVTLADGKVIAGFYVYPMHRGLGNEMDNQIQTVNNYARTLCGGSLYEWRASATYHKDERYAKRISEKVSRTLATADPYKIVTCDDNATQTYYMFLNDDKGTVLVNRYALDVWTMYTGEVFKGVQFAAASQKDVLFASGNVLYRLDPAAAYDVPTEDGGESTPINCVWESGHMDFGADFQRKYSSNLWISMLPEIGSYMTATVQTDRRDEYLVKSLGLPIFDFGNLDFSNFSFIVKAVPKIKRIKIKVKKFVYYKLILRVEKPGARATVLGYDQQVRYSSNVK